MVKAFQIENIICLDKFRLLSKMMLRFLAEKVAEVIGDVDGRTD